jgi:formylglycine-generating enzyme required for sulfatase activity
MMGSPPAKYCRGQATWRETQHEVTLTNALEMSTLEITEEQFSQVMRYQPSNGCGTCPVVNVTWHELAAYCNALSERGEAGVVVPSCFDCRGQGSSLTCEPKPELRGQNIYRCRGFRIMTEAEFEYALRAGTTTDTYAGDLPDPVSCDWNAPPTPANRAVFDKIAIYRSNSGDRRQPVGKMQPNPWGIHDLSGNVWERTFDVRQVDLGSAPVTNPWGAASGTNMTSRGGSFHYMGIYLRSGDRGNQDGSKEDRSIAAGGRCVRTLTP